MILVTSHRPARDNSLLLSCLLPAIFSLDFYYVSMASTRSLMRFRGNPSLISSSCKYRCVRAFSATTFTQVSDDAAEEHVPNMRHAQRPRMLSPLLNDQCGQPLEHI